MPHRCPLRRRLGAALSLAVAAASLGGCLQMAVRPTPLPAPTPTPSPTASPTAPPTPGPPTPTPLATFAAYTVARGDTLTSIGRAFRTSPRSIAYWNRDRYRTLDPESAAYAPNNLQIGWVLRVLPGAEYSPPPDTAESPGAGGDATPAPTEYLGPPTEPPSAGP